MDDHRPPYSLKAPGRTGSGTPRHLPGRSEFPGLDDRLVAPEDTHEEIIGGRRVKVSPALEAHATENNEIGALLKAHARPGYRAAVDMLTRFDADSDFASDACVYRFDPETGERGLEEIAFEVISRQNESLAAEKAVRMHRRGVRRIFAVFVKNTQRVCEWEPTSRSWRLLDGDAAIEDSVCLVKPLPIKALLDAAEADNAVVEALRAKNNPALLNMVAAAEARLLLRLLEAKFGALAPPDRERLAAADSVQLQDWFDRALTAASLRDVFGAPR